nr:unnamed protein product [Callosobruchus analis]
MTALEHCYNPSAAPLKNHKHYSNLFTSIKAIVLQVLPKSTQPVDMQRFIPNALVSASGNVFNRIKTWRIDRRTGGTENPINTGVVYLSSFLHEMMIENRRRGQMIEMFETMSKQKRRSIPTDTVSNLAIMPEILRNLGTIDCDVVKVRRWLDSLNRAKALHMLPHTYMLEPAHTR